MKKNIFLLLPLLFFCISAVFAENDIISDMPEANFDMDKVIAIANGPAYIKHLSRKMKSPGYWTSKIEDPDELILTQQKIQEHNKSVFSVGLGINDILKYPKTIRKASFQRQLNSIFALFARETYLDSSLHFVTKKMLNELKENSKCRITTKTLRTRYAITVNYTDIRLLPTKESFIESKETFDIDRVQVAGIDIGEPLVVISQSKDKKWTYVVSSHSEGWVQTSDIAIAQLQDIVNWINSKNFIVITDTKADIFLDQDRNDYYDYVRMGAKFPLISSDSSKFCIRIPRVNAGGKLYFSKAYIDITTANKGYLDYTQRNVINTAFKHLNSPYAWGGFEGEQDCSTFVRQIYSCFGMLLPRNSSSQIKCGNHPVSIKTEDNIAARKTKITANAKAGLSLLFFPGHIMIYIGSENNNPYVIHALWGTEAYTEKKEKAISFINKILVSDLSLGDGMSKGSLLERTTDFNILN